MPKPENKKIETLRAGGRAIQCKEMTKNVNGTEIKVGIVEGYIATWDLDRGNGWYKDRFIKGAFLESIQRHAKTDRQIRLKDHHGRTVGGFPISTVREDKTGLFGIGEINLEVQQGLEAYKLVQQGVLTDFSIGFGAQDYSFDIEDDEEIRNIKRAEVWEGSIVDEPMNPFANITAVKSLKEIGEIDSIRDYEKLLVDNGFSKKAAKVIISGIKSLKPVGDCDDLNEEEVNAQKREAKDAETLQELEAVRNSMLAFSIKNNFT